MTPCTHDDTSSDAVDPTSEANNQPSPRILHNEHDNIETNETEVGSERQDSLARAEQNLFSHFFIAIIYIIYEF